MTMRMGVPIFLLVLILSSPVSQGADSQAVSPEPRDRGVTVYKWQRPDGTVEFSDQSRSGSEEVTVERPMIVPSRLPPSSQSVSTDSPFNYQRLEIVEPAPESTFRNQAAESIKVLVKAEPSLRKQHLLLLLLDGQAIDEGGRDTTFFLPRLDRGSHTLQVEIRSSEGATIEQSNIIPIHVHRTVAKPGNGS